MESKKEIEVSQFKDTMSSREIADITKVKRECPPLIGVG